MGLVLQFGGALETVIDWLQFPGVNVLVAFGIVLGGWYLSRQIASIFQGNVDRRFRRRSVANLALRWIRAVVVLGALFVSLPVLGFDAGNVLVSVTVVSAIVGVILAPLAQNAISGMLVLINRPYEIGDMIEQRANRKEHSSNQPPRASPPLLVTTPSSFLLV